MNFIYYVTQTDDTVIEKKKWKRNHKKSNRNVKYVMSLDARNNYDIDALDALFPAVNMNQDILFELFIFYFKGYFIN